VNDHRAAVESVFRLEAGRILAALIRVSGSFDLAEEALQEALAAAVAHWQTEGIPRNPGAWITAAAQRKMIDLVRRARTRKGALQAFAREVAPAARVLDDDDEEALAVVPYADDRLRLIFTCCNPALNVEAQVALTLRTLGGLTTPEIARAFLVPEATLAQRLVRAKNKIREARIPYEVPALDLLPERLHSVLAVLYLIFNEGYSASAGESLVRDDLASEAIRLGRMLQEMLPREPEALGLLALMLLQDSRRDARVNARGELVPLEEQERSLWRHAQIEEGTRWLEAALDMASPGPYQLQAAIAAIHARARTAAETDWAEIAALYGQLLRLAPTPVIALNHAVAVAMHRGPEEGLARIERLASAAPLEGYRLLHAARADLLRRLGRREEACVAYARAVAVTTNRVEEAYLRRRLADLS
jgi:RNA polymerase sigma-70 factor (ECF subfamily)